MGHNTVLEDMLLPTYFRTLMAKINFIRFNVCWGPLFLSTYASNVETTVLDDISCVLHYWEMFDNTAAYTVERNQFCFYVHHDQHCWCMFPRQHTPATLINILQKHSVALLPERAKGRGPLGFVDCPVD